jgi:phosphoadenosine phosphosulfate reductase
MLIKKNIMGETEDKIQKAIDLLRMFEPPEGYHLSFSGGKDSQAIYHLAKRAGVKFDAVYRITSVDPPELIRFIKGKYPEVRLEFPRYDDGRVATMWNLIPKKKMPPTRIARYCCAVLKETAGKGELTITGVRWDESVNRKTKQGLISVHGKKAADIAKGNLADFWQIGDRGIVLNYDDAATRRTVEQCYRNRKTLINPIINWRTDDVWEYLNEVEQVEHCRLYDEGFNRIGCVGCPMSSKRVEEFERWPRMRNMYLKAFDKMLIEREKHGLTVDFQDAEEVMKWWIGKTKRVDKDQMTIEDWI